MTVEIGLQLGILTAIASAGVTFGVLMRKVEGLRELIDERTKTSQSNQAEMKKDIHEVRDDLIDMKLERAQLVAIHNMKHKESFDRLDGHEKRIERLESKGVRVEE